MKSLDIVNQLKILLPNYTSYFHESFTVADITVNGGKTYITTNVDHGLNTGDSVTVRGFLTETPISNIEDAENGRFLITTSVEHDQTYKEYTDEGKTVSFLGFTDAEWNASFELVQCGRSNLLITSSNDLPTLNGNEVLLEDRLDGINGLHDITVTGPKEFTIDIEMNGTYDSTWEFVKEVRVDVAFDDEDAVRIYTEQGQDKLWAFVVMDDMVISKDRSTVTDAYFDNTRGSKLRLTAIDGFHVLIFIPVGSYSNVGNAIDLARYDLLVAFQKCLLGVSFDCGFTETRMFKTTLTNSQSTAYDQATYIHRYVYEVVYNIFDDDAVDPAKSRAFRDLNYSVPAKEDLYSNDLPMQDNIDIT